MGAGSRKRFDYKTLGVFVDMGRGKAVAETRRHPLARPPGLAAGPHATTWRSCPGWGAGRGC